MMPFDPDSDDFYYEIVQDGRLCLIDVLDQRQAIRGWIKNGKWYDFDDPKVPAHATLAYKGEKNYEVYVVLPPGCKLLYHTGEEPAVLIGHLEPPRSD